MATQSRGHGTQNQERQCHAAAAPHPARRLADLSPQSRGEV